MYVAIYFMSLVSYSGTPIINSSKFENKYIGIATTYYTNTVCHTLLQSAWYQPLLLPITVNPDNYDSTLLACMPGFLHPVSLHYS